MQKTKRKRAGIRQPNRHDKRRAFHASRADLRERRSASFRYTRPTPEFVAYATTEILPQLSFDGKRKVAQRQDVALQCVLNVVQAGLAGAVVADTRRKTAPGIRLRVAAWDALAAAGLVQMQIGSELSGRVSRYAATRRLLHHFRNWKACQLTNSELVASVRLRCGTSWDDLVILQTGRKAGGRLLEMPAEELEAPLGTGTVRSYLEGVERDIQQINHCNLQHHWLAYRELPNGNFRAFSPNVCLRQLHTANLLCYARYYTWGAASAQNLSKTERQLIEIDGEPVIELDYCGHNLRILYHILGFEPPALRDIYRPELVFPIESGGARAAAARNLVKIATNICLNTASLNAAVRGVRGLLYGNPDSLICRAILKSENATPRSLVDRISEVHPDVAARFFTEIGAKLQTIDGEILRRILRNFAREDRPALGIHDSIVCKLSDFEFAIVQMMRQYYEVLGRFPVVKRVF